MADADEAFFASDLRFKNWKPTALLEFQQGAKINLINNLRSAMPLYKF